LGEAHHLRGSLDEAEPRYNQALSLYESLNDPGGRGFVLSQLGLLELDRGHVEKARELLIESVRLRWSAGERGATADTLEALAETTWRLGDGSSASKLLRMGDLLREETGIARQPVYQARYEQVFHALSESVHPGEALDIDSMMVSLLDCPVSETPISV